MRTFRIASWLAFAAIPALAACSYGPPNVEVVDPDPEMFESEVYPILLRDCAFYACHGNRDRWFRVYGPGRTRLDEDTENYDPPTEKEIRYSFESARASLQGERGIDDSWFVHKPLDSTQGGAGKGHDARDVWGHNVYRSKSDVAYETLIAWAHSRAASKGSKRDAGSDEP